jgi:hypothetical protein
MPRRLQEANVEADYTIAVPESSSFFATIGQKAKDLVAAPPATVQQVVQQAVGTEFKVSDIAQEVQLDGQPLETDTSDLEPTAPPSTSSGPERDEARYPWPVYVGVFLLAVALFMACGYFLLSMRVKKSKRGPQSKRSAKTLAASAKPAPAMPVAQPVNVYQQHQQPTYMPQQAPMAPVSTQAYHMPVYYPATGAPTASVAYPVSYR